MQQIKEEYNYPLALTRQFKFCGNCFRLDLYKGCNHGCNYCFVNVSSRFNSECRESRVIPSNFNEIEKTFKKAFDSDKPSGDLNVELLRHRVPIHCGGMSDPFQSIEKQLGLTKKIIQLTSKYKYPIQFSTKSTYLPDDYIKELNPEYHAFQISLMGRSDEFVKKFESNTPTATERIAHIKRLKSLGFWVSVRIQPLVNVEEAKDLIVELNDHINYVTVEHMKLPIDNPLIYKALCETGEIDNRLYLPVDREAEMPTHLKKRNIEYLKKYAKIPMGCGDNDLHEMSDSLNCCGIDCINKNFDNWIQYNAMAINMTGKKDVWCPKNSCSSVIAESRRRAGNNTVKRIVDEYMVSDENLIKLNPQESLFDLCGVSTKK